MLPEWLIVVITIYLCTHTFGLSPLILTEEWEDDSGPYILLNPKLIYNNVKVNCFGAIFLYLLYFIYIPGIAIVGVFQWLFTIGRK